MTKCRKFRNQMEFKKMSYLLLKNLKQNKVNNYNQRVYTEGVTKAE